MTFDAIRAIVADTVAKLEHYGMVEASEVGARTVDEIACELCDNRGIVHPVLDGELWR